MSRETRTKPTEVSADKAQLDCKQITRRQSDPEKKLLPQEVTLKYWGERFAIPSTMSYRFSMNKVFQVYENGKLVEDVFTSAQSSSIAKRKPLQSEEDTYKSDRRQYWLKAAAENNAQRRAAEKVNSDDEISDLESVTMFL